MLDLNIPELCPMPEEVIWELSLPFDEERPEPEYDDEEL